MIKPSNCVASLKQKVVSSGILDVSGATANVNSGFVDPLHDWVVKKAYAKVHTEYIAAQDTSFNVGVDVGPSGAADEDSIVDAAALGATGIAAGVLTELPLVSGAVLPAGHSLTLGHEASAAQTGTVELLVILERRHSTLGEASKR